MLLGLVNLGVEMVVFPRAVPLSMIFIVALYVPWCRHHDSLPDIKPQLYADNLMCSDERPRALFESARFIAQYARQLVRTFLLVSVSFLVLLCLLGKL